MTPTKEQLQEEFAQQYIQLRKLYNVDKVCQLLIGSFMSEKYKIDIRKYLWNVGGIKVNTKLLDNLNISYYVENNIC